MGEVIQKRGLQRQQSEVARSGDIEASAKLSQSQANTDASKGKLTSGCPGVTWRNGFWRVRVGDSGKYGRDRVTPVNTTPAEVERTRVLAVKLCTDLRRRRELEEKESGAASASKGRKATGKASASSSSKG